MIGKQSVSLWARSTKEGNGFWKLASWVERFDFFLTHRFCIPIIHEQVASFLKPEIHNPPLNFTYNRTQSISIERNQEPSTFMLCAFMNTHKAPKQRLIEVPLEDGDWSKKVQRAWIIR